MISVYRDLARSWTTPTSRLYNSYLFSWAILQWWERERVCPFQQFLLISSRTLRMEREKDYAPKSHFHCHLQLCIQSLIFQPCNGVEVKHLLHGLLSLQVLLGIVGPHFSAIPFLSYLPLEMSSSLVSVSSVSCSNNNSCMLACLLSLSCMEEWSNTATQAEVYQVVYQCLKVMTSTHLTLCFLLKFQYLVSLKFFL